MAGTNDYGVLFPASVVGSMPRSDFVRDLLDRGPPERPVDVGR